MITETPEHPTPINLTAYLLPLGFASLYRTLDSVAQQPINDDFVVA